MIDFTQSVAAGRVAAEETRKLAAELALANQTGKWTPEHSQMAVQQLASAASYMGQVVDVLQAINGQLQEMFGKPAAQPGITITPADVAPTAPDQPTGVAKQLLELILKGAAAQRSEKAPKPGPRWRPRGKR